MSRPTSRTVPLALCLALGVLGCSEPPPTGAVILRVTTRMPAEGAPSPIAKVVTGDSTMLALGGDSILVRRAELVLRDIWLQPAESGECDEDEYCAELRNPAAVVGFPLDDGVGYRLTGTARAGAYSGLQFDIHPPARPDDSAMAAGRPDLRGASARVEGRYMTAGSWRDFIATSKLTGIQELAMEPALQVPAGDTASITLRLDLARLFLDPGGKALFDPTGGIAAQSGARLLDDNIRMSLHAFADEDGDGVESRVAQGGGGM